MKTDSVPVSLPFEFDMSGGDELHGLTGGTINASGLTFSQIDEATWAFSYRVYGHPSNLVEPGFSFLVGRRKSVNIWHSVVGTISCQSHQPVTDASIFGSAFPSHRLWIDGALAQTIRQGPVSDLWNSDPMDPTFVQ